MEELDMPLYKIKPILSDEGSGLKSYASSLDVEHFLCHRHILEGFGSGTFVAALANRLLRAGTDEDYLATAEQVYLDLHILHTRRLISDAQLTRFIDLFGPNPHSSQFAP
jgi:hypothetical protein